MIRSNKQEPRVSPTHIRSIVKQQLASSTTMTTTTTTDSGSGKTQTQTQTHKKQVRRRLHTSRPYQERLLNMAEARREIVTALKQHRASMRQAAKVPPPPPPQNLFYPPPPDPFSWTIPPLNFVLPNQPLGLNLNFHDFNDFIQTSSSSSSSSSTTSSSSSIFPTNPQFYSSPSPPPTFAATSDSVPQPPYPAGEHQPQQLMESENNVATSAWWSELMMKTVEPDPEIFKSEEEVVEDDVFPKFNDVMEFPSWLNTTEEELFHPSNLTHYSSSPHNPPLSCMEIGEIEGMDGDDWLA